MTDQEYLDTCAIEAMGGLITANHTKRMMLTSTDIAEYSYLFARSMLDERKKWIGHKEVQAKYDDPNEAI